MRDQSKIFVIPGADAKDEQYKIMTSAELSHGIIITV